MMASSFGGGANPAMSLGAARQKQEQLRMILRLRPPEDPSKLNTVLERVEDRTVFLRDTRNERYEDKHFSFDAVYEMEKTGEIFDKELGPKALEPLFDGKHCTVFAHGATGSGKTYSMQGDDLGANCGFVPLAVRNILDLWKSKQLDPDCTEEYKVTFSLYELYCDKVRDLLQDLPKEDAFQLHPTSRGVPKATKRWLGDGNPHLRGSIDHSDQGGGGLKQTKYRIDDLPVQMDTNQQEVVGGLSSVPIESVEQFRDLYANRIRQRKTGATSLNNCSSRSHCCIQIAVEKLDFSRAEENGKQEKVSMTRHVKPVQQQVGKLFMVDLAGCEDNRETNTAGRGSRIDESKKINSTYLSLVKVFSALRAGQPLKPVCRDDKLTRLLRIALESSANPTLVLITVNPIPQQLQAILNTFSYLNVAPDPMPTSRGGPGGTTARTDSQRPMTARGQEKAPPRPSSAGLGTTAGEASLAGAVVNNSGTTTTAIEVNEEKNTPPSPTRKVKRFQSPPGGARTDAGPKEVAETSTKEKARIRAGTPTRGTLRVPGKAGNAPQPNARPGTPRRNLSGPSQRGNTEKLQLAPRVADRGKVRESVAGASASSNGTASGPVATGNGTTGALSSSASASSSSSGSGIFGIAAKMTDSIFGRNRRETDLRRTTLGGHNAPNRSRHQSPVDPEQPVANNRAGAVGLRSVTTTSSANDGELQGLNRGREQSLLAEINRLKAQEKQHTQHVDSLTRLGSDRDQEIEELRSDLRRKEEECVLQEEELREKHEKESDFVLQISDLEKENRDLKRQNELLRQKLHRQTQELLDLRNRVQPMEVPTRSSGASLSIPRQELSPNGEEHFDVLNLEEDEERWEPAEPEMLVVDADEDGGEGVASGEGAISNGSFIPAEKMNFTAGSREQSQHQREAVSTSAGGTMLAPSSAAGSRTTGAPPQSNGFKNYSEESFALQFKTERNSIGTSRGEANGRYGSTPFGMHLHENKPGSTIIARQNSGVNADPIMSTTDQGSCSSASDVEADAGTYNTSSRAGSHHSAGSFVQKLSNLQGSSRNGSNNDITQLPRAGGTSSFRGATGSVAGGGSSASSGAASFRSSRAGDGMQFRNSNNPFADNDLGANDFSTVTGAFGSASTGATGGTTASQLLSGSAASISSSLLTPSTNEMNINSGLGSSRAVPNTSPYNGSLSGAARINCGTSAVEMNTNVVGRKSNVFLTERENEQYADYDWPSSGDKSDSHQPRLSDSFHDADSDQEAASGGNNKPPPYRPMQMEDFNRLAISELKQRLKEQSLPTHGRRQELIERLEKGV
ncbi:unnamed protein product [Amoebophrya sp. A120]|nr:unnamed protein product [Amoebophrya sp. A120]|eukprot:GSA120T00002634001.1